MKIYLAGFKTIEKYWPKDESTKDIYLLSSYYEHKGGKFGDYVYQERHILDSGAFSFFGGKKTDWISYATHYANFINKTHQKLFFELDIDMLEGLQYAEHLRALIEDKTGRQSIPVWRPSRGIDYWHRMCEEYKYVAISASGAYDSAWTRKASAVPILNKMIAIAKQHNAKVHGLGFTSVPLLHKIRFYSVDSTTWVGGGKFGKFFEFSSDWKRSIQKRPEGMRVVTGKGKHLNVYSFKQWVKFQQYADKNL